VRLDLRGSAPPPPATHYHFNHCLYHFNKTNFHLFYVNCTNFNKTPQFVARFKMSHEGGHTGRNAAETSTAAKTEIKILRRPATVTRRPPVPIRKAIRSRFSQFCIYFRFCAFTSGLTTTTFFTHFSDNSTFHPTFRTFPDTWFFDLMIMNVIIIIFSVPMPSCFFAIQSTGGLR